MGSSENAVYLRVTQPRFKRDRTVLKRIGKDIGTKARTQGVNGTAQIVRTRRVSFTYLHRVILDNGLERISHDPNHILARLTRVAVKRLFTKS
jgi:hypothetical protein